ncbi:hypothetical protein BgiBS90_010543 [Biomphalaria glabrata]|nr:hypothetical protein BgiBS90_010543 [Biomphalaria glabrata]
MPLASYSSPALTNASCLLHQLRPNQCLLSPTSAVPQPMPLASYISSALTNASCLLLQLRLNQCLLSPTSALP